jgi:hypothetical protein
MHSIHPRSGSEETAQDTQTPRNVLRKYRQPVAVYDLSRKNNHRLYVWLGRAIVLCVLAGLALMGVVWATHWQHSASNAASVSEPAVIYDLPVAAQSLKLGYVAFWGVTSSGVSISWSTDVPATTLLSYGTTPALGQKSPAQTTLTTAHGVTLTGLKSGTTYYFVARSVDKNGLAGRSTPYSFTTLALAGGPSISGIVVKPGPNNKVEISWTTSVPTFSYVQFGSTTAYNRFSTRTPLTVKPNPSITWVPSGVVHYQLVSTDSAGKQTVSPDQTFVEP